MEFRDYLVEWKDIFGFDQEVADRQEKNKTSNDEPPIEPIDSELFLSELNRMSLGTRKPLWDWHNKVQWGESRVGAIMADVSPLGSSKVFIRRLAADLQGDPIWICKAVVPLEELDHNKTETSLAHDLFRMIEEVDHQEIDSPSKDYKDFRKLSQTLMTAARTRAPSIFVYEGAKQMDDHWTMVYFSYRGAGQGGSGIKLEQFNVNLTFDPENGILRSWGNEVSSSKVGGKWQLSPSEWDEYFLPSQPMKEVVDVIINALSTY